MKIFRTILLYSLYIVLIFTRLVYAEEMLKIESSMPKETLSGIVKDDHTVSIIHLSHHGDHDGFQLWLNNQRTGTSDIYDLRGMFNSNHILRVKLKKNDSHTDNKNGNGIIFNTKNESEFFILSTYGDQMVYSDIYQIQFSATLIQQ